MDESTLDNLLEISDDQTGKMRLDLAKVCGFLKTIKGASKEIYVVRFSYLDPEITVEEQTNVSLRTYLERIKGALENGLEQGKFSIKDAYFLKAIFSPYLQDVKITELERALPKD